MTTLIIGSGLSALAVFKALSSATSAEVEIIDTNYRHTVSTKNSLQASALKTLFGSSHMYEKTQSEKNVVSTLSFSYAAGGFSTVWGAGIRLWDASSLSEITKSTDAFYESARILLEDVPYFGTNQTMNIPLAIPISPVMAPYTGRLIPDSNKHTQEHNLKIFQTPLAVKTTGFNACVGCGMCLKGCPYGSIFNTSEFFDNLVSNGAIKRIHGKVVQLKELENNVEVKYKNDLGETTTKLYEEVYLCAGAIGTPAILLQSNLVGKELEVKDSQVFYFIGLYRRKIKKPKYKFSLSRETITDVNQFSASLYECNSEVRNRLSLEISKKLFGLRVRLPRIIDRYIFLGIGFLDSDKSGHINLKLNSLNKLTTSITENSETREAVIKSIKVISRSLRKYNLWVLPWLTTSPPVGAGFHSGASLPIDSEFVDSVGQLRNSQRIKIGDASLLPKIFAGSHTFNSMTFNHSLIVNKKA